MTELSDSISRAGEALKVAEGKAMQAMVQNPTAASVAAFEKAHKAVAEHEARQARERQAGASEGQGPSERVFKNPRQVAAFLMDQGWKVSENTLYNHRDRNLIRPNQDGLFLERDVLRYANDHLRRKDGAGSAKLEALQERKALAEIERAEAQAGKLRLQQEILEGKYIALEQYQRDLATRARLLKADMLGFMRLAMEEIIFLVQGDPSRAPEALALAERMVEDWLHRYASQGEIRLAAPRIQEEEA